MAKKWEGSGVFGTSSNRIVKLEEKIADLEQKLSIALDEQKVKEIFQELQNRDILQIDVPKLNISGALDQTIDRGKLADRFPMPKKGDIFVVTEDLPTETGTVYVCFLDGVWSEVSRAPRLEHVVGRFYSNGFVTTTTTAAISANTLYAVPFYVPVSHTYPTINLSVTTGVGGTSIRLGIYSDNAGYPGALVIDAGTISSAGVAVGTLTINQLLSSGWYWLVGVGDGAPTVRAISSSFSFGMLYFGQAAVDTSASALGLSVAFTYATLPTTFPAGGTLFSSNMMRIMLEA